MVEKTPISAVATRSVAAVRSHAERWNEKLYRCKKALFPQNSHCLACFRLLELLAPGGYHAICRRTVERLTRRGFPCERQEFAAGGKFLASGNQNLDLFANSI
jgi:hypothetical protein